MWSQQKNRRAGTEGAVLGEGVPPARSCQAPGASDSEQEAQAVRAPRPGWADAAAGSGRLSGRRLCSKASRNDECIGNKRALRLTELWTPS